MPRKPTQPNRALRQRGPDDAPLKGASDSELRFVVEDVLRSNRFRARTGESVPPAKLERFHSISKSVPARRESLNAPVALPDAPVEPTAEVADGEPALRADEWYVMLEGKPVGPLTLQAMKSLLEDGTVHREVACWSEGLQAWHPLRELEQLLALLSPEPEALSPQLPPRFPQWVPAVDEVSRHPTIPPSGRSPRWQLLLASLLGALGSGALVACYFLWLHSAR